MPVEHLSKTLERDYEQMKEMIYGGYPTYDVIMETIEKFETRIKEVFQNR